MFSALLGSSLNCAMAERTRFELEDGEAESARIAFAVSSAMREVRMAVSCPKYEDLMRSMSFRMLRSIGKYCRSVREKKKA